MKTLTSASFAVTAAGYVARLAVPTGLPFQGRGVSAGVGSPTFRRTRIDVHLHDSAMEAIPV